MDGLISFFASHYAIRAETVLRRGGFASQLIPGPKDLSPNCGVALRFEYAHREDVLAALAAKKVQIDGLHRYVPRTDAFRNGSARETQ
jgi:Putative Se/S carrier protein-like